MMKDSFVSKYKELGNDEPTAGMGETFPDQERSEQLDIRGLLLSQPKNVLSELAFHKDLFSKLKFNYVEQESQEKFLKRVLEIPALFVQEAEVKDLEEKSLNHKKRLKEKKREIQEKKENLENLIERVSAKYADTRQKKDQVFEFIEKISVAEKKFKGLKHESIRIEQDTVQQASERINQQKSKIEDLRQEIKKWTDILQEKKESNSSLDQKLTILKENKNTIQTQAADAIRASKNKNPQYEELCKWYTEINSLLYKCTGISHIRNISDTEFAIDYESDSTVVATLFLKVDPDADAHFKRLVNAKVKGIHCPIQDIVIHGNLTITKLDELLSFIVSCAKTRIFENLALEQEIKQLLQTHPGLVWDPETRQILIHAESSGRAFVIGIKTGYPSLGWQSFEFVGIEPCQGDSEIELWQDRIIQSQVNGLKDLVCILD